MADVTCPHCRMTMADAPGLAGQAVSCPRCNGQFLMPGATVAAAAAMSIYQSTVSQRFQPATSILDIFDLRFEKYVTPIIIRFTWVLCLLGALLMVVALSYNVLAPEDSFTSTVAQRTPQRVTYGESADESPDKPRIVLRMDTPTVRKVSAYLFGLFVVAQVVLWLRVALESAIVLFNIANSLQSIDQKTKRT